MTWTDRISLFSAVDLTAVFLLILAWFLTTYLIENAPTHRPSVAMLMAHFRRDWMRRMAERDVRIFDAQIMNGLRQGTAFFASTTMIAIGGILALIGNTDLLAGVASDLTLNRAPKFVWEVKMMLTLAFVTNAFLKFVWSHRLFGYCAILIASVPNDPNDTTTLSRAMTAGEVNVTAARSYNRGLRSIYFSIGSIAWILGPIPLLIATAVTVSVLWRREFMSNSRRLLIQELASKS